MKMPVIGLTPSHDLEHDRLYLYPNYLHALRESGAACLVFPLGSTGEELRRLVSLCDGILFTGGPDIQPLCFGEDTLDGCGDAAPLRDKMELELLPLAMEAKKSIFGVCRGIQLINVALGGDIYQDLGRQFSSSVPPLAHLQPFHPSLPAHRVSVAPQTRLHTIVQENILNVNSLHHQAIRTLAPGLTPCAWSSDGLVEAAEMDDYPFLLAVQWHPEYLFDNHESARRLFRAFVQSCSK